MLNMLEQNPMPESPQYADTEAPEENVDNPVKENVDVKARIQKVIDSVNLAEDMEKDELIAWAKEIKQGFDVDMKSQEDWQKECKTWTELALQVREDKTYPWHGASNVKYPLLSTAAMQFNARAYPSLVPSNMKLVNAVVQGKDPDGSKAARAARVSEYMSYQLLVEMEDWEKEMDKLLMTLPITGMCFKKTYFDSVRKVNVSRLILPTDLIVNYWACSLEEAERVSEIIYMTKRLVKGRQKSGIFLDVELGDPVKKEGQDGVVDATTPYKLIEQHCYRDVDGDGIEEPYIVTMDYHSGHILRVVARFLPEGVKLNESGDIIEIVPNHYYTKYSFIPNPDGSFCDIGFGSLLGPLNESVNTLVNQLLDAGHINNLQSGFLGKGLKLKMGEHRFRPGEWKTINSSADDLKKQILPLPTKEPSNVLFQLMGSLVTSGKELASVAEIFVGKMPGQNTPATTTMASIEQGMKVFTAVYKRIYRSLTSEFKKLYYLNQVYGEVEKYVAFLDEPVTLQDFQAEGYDICPGADPNAISQTEKLMKAQGLMELLPTGTLDPIAVVKRVLEAQEQPNPEELFIQQIQQTGQMPEPPPDPKMLEMQMKGQMEQQKLAMQAQAQQQKMQLESADRQVQLAMKAQEHQQNMQHRAEMANVESALAQHKQAIFAAEGQQKLIQNAMTHRQNMQLSKEKASSQRQNSTSGKAKTPRKKS